MLLSWSGVKKALNAVWRVLTFAKEKEWIDRDGRPEVKPRRRDLP